MADYKLEFTAADAVIEHDVNSSGEESDVPNLSTPSEHNVSDPTNQVQANTNDNDSANTSANTNIKTSQMICSKTQHKAVVASSLLLLIVITSCTCRGYVQGIVMLVTHYLHMSQASTSTVPLSFDFGFTTAVLFVSYNGGKRHRTRWIAVGTILIGLGTLISTLGYFISKDKIDELEVPSLSIQLCNVSDMNVADKNHKDPGPGTPTLSWLSIGLILCGFGAAPQISLGLTYICDSLPVKYTPLYIAAIYSANGLGYILGELLSFNMRQDVQTITHDRVTWGSAVMNRWWVGFCVMGLIVLAIGLVILTFQKINITTDDGESPEVRHICQRHETFGKYRPLADEVSISTSRVRPKTMVRLLQNPTLLSSCAAHAFEGAILCGIYQFLPPFLERDYGVKGGVADIRIASVVVFGLLIGGICAAFVLIKGQVLQLKSLCQVILVFGLISWGLYWSFFSPHCDGIKVSPYQDRKTPCHCSQDYFPICGSDGVVYASPCHAGCTHGNHTDFVNCSFSRDDVTDGRAIVGVCSADCDPMWSIMLLLFFTAFITGIQQVPATVVVLRCVSHSDRSVAIGLMLFITYALGVLPAVIYFPAHLQNSCLLSQPPDQSIFYECLAYDSLSFRFIFFGHILILKCLSLVFFALSWWSTKKQSPFALNERSSVNSTYTRFGMDGYDETFEL